MPEYQLTDSELVKPHVHATFVYPDKVVRGDTTIAYHIKHTDLQVGDWIYCSYDDGFGVRHKIGEFGGMVEGGFILDDKLFPAANQDFLDKQIYKFVRQ